MFILCASIVITETLLFIKLIKDIIIIIIIIIIITLIIAYVKITFPHRRVIYEDLRK